MDILSNLFSQVNKAARLRNIARKHINLAKKMRAMCDDEEYKEFFDTLDKIESIVYPNNKCSTVKWYAEKR